MLSRAWLAPLLFSVACSRPNPAFDGGSDVSASGSESGLTLDTGESSSATTDPSTTDPGTSDSSTTDPGTTTDPSTTDTGTSDTGIEQCPYDFGTHLQLGVSLPDDPNCSDVGEVSILVPLGSFNVTPGVVTGFYCPSFDCTGCSDVVNAAVGAIDYAPLAGTWDLLGGLIEQAGVDGLCLELAANTMLGTSNDMCLYAALGIFDRSIENGPIFIGQMDAAPMTWIANAVLAQKPQRQPIGSCSCASLFDGTTDLSCCENSGSEPTFFELQLGGITLAPGESSGLPIQQAPWFAEVLRAYDAATCNNPSGAPREAWALTRIQ